MEIEDMKQHTYLTSYHHVTIVAGVVLQLVIIGGLMGYFQGAFGWYNAPRVFTWNMESAGSVKETLKAKNSKPLKQNKDIDSE